MKTGEGKTLTATMPLYLHGLVGNGVFLITANEYLARRDAKEIGKVYRWLGLTVSLGVPEIMEDDSQRDLKKIYSADIIYTTHSELGFDYLFDNLAESKEKKYLPPFNYAIIDEIDSILLDQAQTPLIVSGAPEVQSNLFKTSQRMVSQLKKDVDFKQSDDGKNVWITKTGLHNIENYLGISNILSSRYRNVYRHIVIALKANYLFNRDRNYVVENDKVILLDKMNGRKLMGTKLESGLHQALEAKEHVKITQETKAVASITYQNLFRLFKRISGMTGTAKTDADEFRDVYHLNTVVIPSNKKVIRQDHPDHIYVTNKEKIESSLKLVAATNRAKRPILIETGSVSMSELYSRLLLYEGYPHNVLNATSATKENRIIKEAGHEGAITVATSMAGRGTDIKITDGARKAGGLLVLGTERMSSARIDNQLRGRAGRQGDPGDSAFYVSLEDKVVVENAPKWVKKYRKRHDNARFTGNLTGKARFKHVIDKSQSIQRNREFSERLQNVEFDEVVKTQRNYVYATRNKIIYANQFDDLIDEAIKKAIDHFVATVKTISALNDFIYNNIDYAFIPSEHPLPKNWRQNRPLLKYFLLQLITTQKAAMYQKFPNADQLDYYKRIVLLKSIDAMWIDQVSALQQLKSVVGDRSWAQHTPVYEYQQEAKTAFANMRNGIYRLVLKNILLSEIVYRQDGTIDIVFP